MNFIHFQRRNGPELHHRQVLSNLKRQNDVPRPIPKKTIVRPVPPPTPTRVVPTPTPTRVVPTPTPPVTKPTETTPTVSPATVTKDTTVQVVPPTTSTPLTPSVTPSSKTALPVSSGTGTAVRNQTLSGSKPTASAAGPTGSGGISTGTLIGVIAATIIGVLLILAIIVFFFRKYRERKNREDFSPTRFRKSAINLDDGAPDIRPQPSTMTQNHMDNGYNYNNFDGVAGPATGYSHSAYPAFGNPYTMPRNEAPLPPVPAAAAEENPFLPPAYTPSDTTPSPTSTTHSYQHPNRYAGTAVSESVYSQPSYLQPDPSTYVNLMRANAAGAAPSSSGHSSAASAASTTTTGYPNEKAGYYLSNPTVPATTATGYPNEKAGYYLNNPAAAKPDENRMSTVYSVDDAYGGM